MKAGKKVINALQTLTFGFPLVIKNNFILAGMYYRRALVAHAAKYIPQALSDVTQAIKIKPNFLKAIVMRAEIFLTIGLLIFIWTQILSRDKK